MRWRVPWWGSVLTVLLSALMLSAGIWQLGRGDDKQALLDAYAAASLAPPDALQADTPAQYDAVRRVQLSGRYAPAQQLLLDNQGMDGRPGFRVWTPFVVTAADGTDWRVLVDRGWIPREQGLARSGLEVGSAARELQGYWQALPRPGLRLQVDNCAAQPWPRVVQYPTGADLACLYAPPPAPGLLLLDPAAPEGFVRRWSTAPELQPAKHYGYAAQWFAFTVTLIAIVLKLGLRRTP